METTVHEHQGLRGLQGSRSKYIFTHDLVAAVDSLALGLELNAPDPSDDVIASVTNDLSSALAQHMRQAEIVHIDAAELSRAVLERARQYGSRFHIVSTCPEMGRVRYANTIEVNRMVDLHGQLIGLGARPGHATLAEQARIQVELAAGRPIVIAEDGVFTGSTLACLIDTIKNQGGTVHAVVAGFIFNQAQSLGGQLYERYSDVEFVQAVDCDHGLLDWMPDHDFLPLLPNCGRVLGVKLGPVTVPYYGPDGISYSIPYLAPFCPMKAWTSISGDTTGFSHTCLSLVQRIYQRLSELNGQHRIMMRQLFNQRLCPAVCMPFEHGHVDDIIGTLPKNSPQLQRRHRLEVSAIDYLYYLNERVVS